MRNILLSIAVGAVLGGTIQFLSDNMAFSIATGILSAIIVFFVLTKKIMKQVEILNNKAQKAIRNQNFDRAINIYKTGIDLGKISPFIAPQMHGMIGMLYYVQKKNDEAKPSLVKASNMNWMAKGMLGVIYMNEGNTEEMNKTFRKMVTSTGKKEGLSWGLYAFCLNKLKRKDDAIKILEEADSKLKGNDERIKKNLLELKNGRKMQMKLFGDAWYQFLLEMPPRNKMMQNQYGQPSHMRVKKNAMYKGR